MKRVFVHRAPMTSAIQCHRRLFTVMATLLAILILNACSAKPESAQVSGNVRVLAPMTDSDPSKGGGYQLQFVELIGLVNLQEVAGKFAHFFFSPRISDGHLQGNAPKARFLKNNEGSFIPVNDISQQMVVIYSHFQKLAQLDEDLGAPGINQWPRDIGMGVRVTGGSDNNAFYDGVTDSMLFVPYTQNNLPIAVNGGILAHEHFHSLFYKIVMKGFDQQASIHDRQAFLKFAGITDAGTHKDNQTSTDSLNQDLHLNYHVTLLRGINEGLADFWGWMYTGNVDFIAASLPQEKTARSLTLTGPNDGLRLSNTVSIKRSVQILQSYQQKNVKQYLTSYSYYLGTQVSRMMKRFTEKLAETRKLQPAESRKQVAKWLLKSLPSVRLGLGQIQDGSYYGPSQFLTSFVQVIPDLQESECEFFLQVWNGSFIDEAKMSCKAQGNNWNLVAD